VNDKGRSLSLSGFPEFFLVQKPSTKTEKNISNDHKITPMAIKYTKYLMIMNAKNTFKNERKKSNPSRRCQDVHAADHRAASACWLTVGTHQLSPASEDKRRGKNFGGGGSGRGVAGGGSIDTADS
jgi:hypothetical protein